jgi:hypothetical protein
MFVHFQVHVQEALQWVPHLVCVKWTSSSLTVAQTARVSLTRDEHASSCCCAIRQFAWAHMHKVETLVMRSNMCVCHAELLKCDEYLRREALHALLHWGVDR